MSKLPAHASSVAETAPVSKKPADTARRASNPISPSTPPKSNDTTSTAPLALGSYVQVHLSRQQDHPGLPSTARFADIPPFPSRPPTLGRVYSIEGPSVRGAFQLNFRMLLSPSSSYVILVFPPGISTSHTYYHTLSVRWHPTTYQYLLVAR
jgi:hypothetical protein